MMVRLHRTVGISVTSVLSMSRAYCSSAFVTCADSVSSSSNIHIMSGNFKVNHPYHMQRIAFTRNTCLYMSTNSKSQKGKKKELFRADKVLSQRANLSRSQAFDYLQRRRIAMRDPNAPESDSMIPVTGPKVKISMDAILYMDGKPIPQLPPILMAFHKPKYVLSALEEKHSDKAHLGKYLPERLTRIGMHPVGRLDYDTTGLLLFSREGELTQRLLHPKSGIEKEYIATCAGGQVDVDSLKEKLKDGVETGEGIHVADLLSVEQLSLEASETIKQQYQADDINPNDIELPLTDVNISVKEGKYRMVRRMLANCGHPVIELRRERHGNIMLKDLPEGEFRDCDEDEIDWAVSLMKR
jgi:23S rRNA pseudouridine2605 synthase